MSDRASWAPSVCSSNIYAVLGLARPRLQLPLPHIWHFAVQLELARHSSAISFIMQRTNVALLYELWQIASACWELYCLEHGIHSDGTMCQDNNLDNDSKAFFSSCFCHTTKTFKYVPRVVLVDFEPIPMDEIWTGCYRSLFDPSTLITGKEDAASNYGRGYGSLGCEIIDVAMDGVRRVAEGCDSLQGFITLRSIAGGTGSEFGTLLQEKVTEDFCKSSRHEFTIFPSPK